MLRAAMWILVLLVSMAPAARAAQGRFVIADVVVNGAQRAPAMIHVALDGTIRARRDDVLQWQLVLGEVPGVMLGDIEHVTLTGLPDLQAVFDGSVLTLQAAAWQFAGARIDLRRAAAPAVDSSRGGFINYDFNAFATRSQRAAWGMAIDAVWFDAADSFNTTGVLSDGTGGARFVRYESAWVRDFPALARTLVVGDSIARSGTLARGFRFGGLSYGSNFAIRPDIVTFALPAVPGEARLPTSADLLINGQLQSRLQLPPGPFEIANVPAINGAGEVQLVTRDTLGRQQVLVVPFYVSPSLLARGVVDAGVEAGRVRENFALDSARYGRAFGRAIVRTGLSDQQTLEAHAEVTKGGQVVGTGLTANLGGVAVATVAAAVRGGEQRGHASTIAVERATRGFSFGLRGQFASRGFEQIGEPAGLRSRLSANASLPVATTGTASVVYVRDTRHDRSARDTTAITYQHQFGRRVSMQATWSRGRAGPERSDYVGVSLAMPLDNLASASLAATRQAGRENIMLDWRQNMPPDGGIAGRARLAAGGGERLDAGLSWQNAFGQWSADASAGAGADSVRLGATGSLVMAGGVIRAVRQLGDAFGIVIVPGHGGIDVMHENQRVATTDAAGVAVIPRLRAFESNAISLDTASLKLTTELKLPERRVTPGRRAGVVMTFVAENALGALATLVTEDGQPVPAGAEVEVGSASFPVAARGEAWLTGLGAEMSALVRWGAQSCSIRIPAVDASQARARIGPLVCRAGKQT